MKTINKNVVYLGWVSFFTDLASSMITTLLPLYVVYILNEGVDKLGIVIAVATFVSYFFRILFGYISQKYQLVKPLVVTGYLISAVTKPLLALTQSYQGVAVMRGLERMGKAVRSAPKDALISAYSEKNASGKTFGFHKTLDIAGELTGAILVFFVLIWFTLDEQSIRYIFAFTLIPGLAATLLAIFFVRDVPFQEKTGANAVMHRDDLRLLPVLVLYFVSLLFVFSDQFYIVQAKEAGYMDNNIPLFVIAFTLTQTLASYASGLLIDRFGTHRLLWIAILCSILSVLSLWKHWIWLSFILLGLFTVISLNVIRAFISAEAKSKAFVYGIFYGGVALFSSLGAVIVGQLWERLGFDSAIYFSLAGLTAILLLLTILTFRQN